MKSLFTITFAAGVLALASCGDASEAVQSEPAAPEATPTVESKVYYTDNSLSEIAWAGTKLAGGGHDGTVKLKKGMLTLKEDKIESGAFEIDLSTMANSDIEDAEEKAKLIGHLSSPDFFDVAQFPMAVFTVTNASDSTLSGNLQMKGQAREITFPIAYSTMNDGRLKATGSVTIDRTQWGINYGSSALADAFLGDDISLDITLVAKEEGGAAAAH